MSKEQVRNILKVYNNASAESLRAGISWYADAHKFALSLESNVERSAAVIAVLSPNTSWTANKTLALKAYLTMQGEGLGFSDKVNKVNRLFGGENPHEVVRGPKVTAFFQTILNPWDSEIIPVIDRHAQDIADGVRGSEKSRNVPSGKRYAEYADAYREASAIVGLTPHMLQAVTWDAWRKWHGITA